MKRIKRLVFIFVILLSVVLLSACKKDYSSITYKRFTAKMSDELGYSVTDNSLSYEGIYERYISASKEGVIFIFMEFEDKDSAESYMKGYEKQKGYSYNKKDDYTIVKNSKGGYVKIIQIDNIIISGSTEKSNYRTDVNKAFKSLGY